jgi:hypothetical protein
MSKYSQVLKAIAGLEKKLGVKFATVDEMARAVAKERAIKADLPDVVFHGSPHAFEDFKVGEDYFRHVAPDPHVAAQRIKDLNIPVEERKFNLTPEQAKKMGFSPEDIKKGIILELRTKLGNPLTVKDKGTFSLSGLLEDPAVQNVLDAEDLKVLQDKSASIDDRWLDSEAFNTPTFSGLQPDPKTKLKAKKLAEALAKEEREAIDYLGKALKKKGYDSLHYQNTAEILPEYEELHAAYAELGKKELEIRNLLAKETNPKKISEYTKLQKQLNNSLQKLESKFPESYALFPDAPVRHITAEMDPAKLKSEPGSLSKNIAIATGAGTAASTMMPEESEAGVTYKLNQIARLMDNLPKNATALDFVKNANIIVNPKTAADIGANRIAFSNALEASIRKNLGLGLGTSNEQVIEELLKTYHPGFSKLDVPITFGEDAKKVMKKEGVKKADGVFYTEGTDHPNIPYKAKGIAVADGTAATTQHELGHATEYFENPESLYDTSAQLFGGKNSSDIFNATNEELAKKMSTLDGRSVDQNLGLINKLRPEGIGKSLELRKFINTYFNKFDFGDANHFVHYPKNYELNKALEFNADKVKGYDQEGLIKNKQLIDKMLKYNYLTPEQERKFKETLKTNADFKERPRNKLVLPDKMIFGAGAAGIGLAGAGQAEAAEDNPDENKVPFTGINIGKKLAPIASKIFGKPHTEEEDKYLDEIRKNLGITSKPDFTETMGETVGGAMNSLTDKFAPFIAKDEEGGDYTPISLTDVNDAPMRALKVVDNVTGRPLRRSIYETLGGEEGKDVSGFDIMDKLQDKYGAMPEMPGATLKMKDALGLGLDLALDPTILIPAAGEIKLGSKLGAKLGMEAPTLGKVASRAYRGIDEFTRIEEAAKAAKEAAEAAEEARRVKVTNDFLNSREQIRRVLD